MCLSAIYWAGIDKVFYGNTRLEAEAIDFSDKEIYDEIPLSPMSRRIPSVHVGNVLTMPAFVKWQNKADKTKY
jgi:tRNA(Arg) A34 adenosine deaminase TadA